MYIHYPLRTLKKGQSQDTMLFSNELFMLQNIGEDLKLSILLFCNKIKNNMTIPDFLQNIHVTAINKKKKCPLSLDGLRGIFLVPKLRAILVKLIYNSIIDVIESHLTNSNIGSRKNKSPRDHLFVVYSVMNETLRGGEPRDFVFYDIKECYDSLWVRRCLLDMFDNGLTLNLLNLFL